jgi:alkylhydroperoxidase family enzyme
MGDARYVQEEGHRLQELDNYLESDRFAPREKIAIQYCDALMDNPSYADKEMWEELLAEFTPAELVELGHYIVLRIAGQRWIMSVRAEHGQLAEFIESKSRNEVSRS